MSGLISGSEAAYFALSPQEIDKLKKDGEEETKKGKKGRLILRLKGDEQRLLATILIANNLVNVSIVMLSAYFTTMTFDFGTQNLMKFIFETIVITGLILLLGEIAPKIYANSHHIAFASIMASPLKVAVKVFKPASSLLMKSTNLVNSRLSKISEGQVSQDDLEQALELTSGSMKDERDMLEGIVKFMDLDVSDLMTPRIDVVTINYGDSFSKVLSTIVESGYSRLPVTGETQDDVKGIIYVKDIMRDLGNGDSYDWHPRIRHGFFVPETKKVNDLLTEFQSTKTHMAIIMDEYGCMQGVITLEDIMEEIVGDITDEQDEEEREWYRQADGSWVFEAKVSLNDFFKATDIESETFEKVRGDAETLAGLLLEKTGVIPKKKDIVEIAGYKFEILSADNRKINKVKMTQKA